MSSEAAAVPYSQTYIVAWTILSVVIAAAVFTCFVFGESFLNAGHWIWDLIRYFARPII